MTPSLPLRCGVSGWTHSGWDRAVFPRPQARGFHAVEFLAHRLDSLEIDSTFYQFHRPELVRLWGAKAAHNPLFKFTARLHRQFTHERELDGASVAQVCPCRSVPSHDSANSAVAFPHVAASQAVRSEFVVDRST